MKFEGSDWSDLSDAEASQLPRFHMAPHQNAAGAFNDSLIKPKQKICTQIPSVYWSWKNPKDIFHVTLGKKSYTKYQDLSQ